MSSNDNNQAQLDALREQMNRNFDAQRSSIEGIYSGLIAEQQKYNQAYEGGTRTEGIVSGRERYAPVIQGGIFQSAVNEGLAKISAIQAKKAALLTEVENARADKNYEILTKKMEEVRLTEKAERDEAQRQFENGLARAQEARAKAKEVRDQSAYELDNAAASVAQVVNRMTDDTQREAYYRDYSKRIGVSPEFLKNAVVKFNDDYNKDIGATIRSLSEDYVDAGITTEDVRTADLTSVLNKVTNSNSYRMANRLKQAQIDAELAQAAKAGAAGGDADAMTLQYYAEQFAETGKMPPYIPKGYQGVVNELAKEYAKDNLAKGTLVSNTTGLAVPSGRISEAQRGALGAGSSLFEQSERLRRFFNDIVAFPAAGTVIKGGKIINLSPEDQETFNSIAGNMLSSFVQSRSGLAASDKERKLLAELLPTENQWKKYNVARLDQFIKGFRSTMAGSLSQYNATLKGIDLRSDKELRDMFAGSLEDGEILVRNWENGEIQAILPEEYDETIHEKIIQ